MKRGLTFQVSWRVEANPAVHLRLVDVVRRRLSGIAHADHAAGKRQVQEILVGRESSSAGSGRAPPASPPGMPDAAHELRREPDVHAGSQNPQKPVPGAYSSSVPNRRRCSPFCQVIVSTNV